MYVRSPVAYAWLDDAATAGQAPAKSPSINLPKALTAPSPKPQVLFARRAYDATLGRCIAVKLVHGKAGSRLFVLLVPRYTADKTPRWLSAQAVISEEDVYRWVGTGFDT